MDLGELLVAVVAGFIQGIFEWLPISSQGNLSVFFTAVGESADVALQLSLFLHLGTTLAAAVYYREDLGLAVSDLPEWRPRRAFEDPHAEPSFIVVATATTGLVGIPLYVLAVDVASDVSGAVFIVAIGLLLVLTGVLQLASDAVGLGEREEPSLRDAVIVGAAQGLSILPGVSRSGMTTSALLFEGYDAPAAFRLSFLLAIPAGVGGAALTMADVGGLPEIGLWSALIALGVSAIVGYLVIGALLAIVERVPFWAVCFGLGGLAILGGGLVVLL